MDARENQKRELLKQIVAHPEWQWIHGMCDEYGNIFFASGFTDKHDREINGFFQLSSQDFAIYTGPEESDDLPGFEYSSTRGVFLHSIIASAGIMYEYGVGYVRYMNQITLRHTNSMIFHKDKHGPLWFEKAVLYGLNLVKEQYNQC